MSSYAPAVTCFGSVGSASTISQTLIDMIPTTLSTLAFGYSGAPYKQVTLPRRFLQPRSSSTEPSDTKNGFYAEVYSNDRHASSASSWFDIWAAVVSINSLCVSEGKAGFARLQQRLKVKVDRAYRPPPGLVMGGSAGNATVSLMAEE